MVELRELLTGEAAAAVVPGYGDLVAVTRAEEMRCGIETARVFGIWKVRTDGPVHVTPVGHRRGAHTRHPC